MQQAVSSARCPYRSIAVCMWAAVVCRWGLQFTCTGTATSTRMSCSATLKATLVTCWVPGMVMGSEDMFSMLWTLQVHSRQDCTAFGMVVGYLSLAALLHYQAEMRKLACFCFLNSLCNTFYNRHGVISCMLALYCTRASRSCLGS